MRFKCNKKEDCKHCGECCHFREQKIMTDEEDLILRKRIYDKTGVIYLKPFSDYTISISNKEKRSLELLSKEKNILVKFEPKKLIIKENKVRKIDWYLDHDTCPFWLNERCSIYEHRPEICRCFPLMPKIRLSDYPHFLTFEDASSEAQKFLTLHSALRKRSPKAPIGQK